MEHIFTLEGLDCPNCAAKIEREVGALSEIESASVNLMQQSLTVTTAHAAEEVHALIEKIVHKHEPDVAVRANAHHEHCHDHCHGHEHEHEHEHEHAHAHAHEHTHERGRADGRRVMLIRLIAGAAVFAAGAVMHYALHAPAGAVFAVMLTAYIILGWDVVLTALRNITRGQIFDEHFLMSISTVGAFVLGEYPEAAAVMLFYQIGEYFQSLAVERSRRSIKSLLDIRPDTANLITEDGVTETAAEDIRIGSRILIKAGERVPLDGTVLEGESMLDTAALTGESVPRRVHAGDDVLSGCINQSGTLTVRVTHTFGESTASRIIEMVQNAAARKVLPVFSGKVQPNHFFIPLLVVFSLYTGLVIGVF